MRTLVSKQKPSHQTNPVNARTHLGTLAAKNSSSSSILQIESGTGDQVVLPLRHDVVGAAGISAASVTNRLGHDFSRMLVNARDADPPSDPMSWPTPLQGQLEHAFGVSLENIPLMVDPSLQPHAAAATDGVEIRIDPRWLKPESKG